MQTQPYEQRLRLRRLQQAWEDDAPELQALQSVRQAHEGAAEEAQHHASAVAAEARNPEPQLEEARNPESQLEEASVHQRPRSSRANSNSR